VTVDILRAADSPTAKSAVAPPVPETRGHCPPVLVLAFNRPDNTRAVLDAIRPARPQRLFLAVDGPRADRPGEREQVLAVQRLAEAVDWPCEVDTLFRAANLGCKVAVSDAITWFFDQVDAGIILEDDCIAHPSFFAFAAELLAYYHDDTRVCMISGDNFQFGRRRTPHSYYFSRYTHIWGWASWRRAWRWYDHGMSLWPQLRDGGWLMDMLQDRVATAYWTGIFEATWAEQNSSWAYRWTYSAWVNSALTVLPSVNLVSNIGFGGEATHTRNRRNRFAALPLAAMAFPLRHPPCLIRDTQADGFTQRTMFRTPLWRRTAGRLLRALRGRR
jgi:hypothetical protein